MDATTLAAAMGSTLGGPSAYTRFVDAMNAAMIAADITTPLRAAHWCGQLAHESGGLKYMAEIRTSDPSWNADRTRYRGRGPIQLTWRANYEAFGKWCAGRGFTTDPTLFVNQPELVEQPRWGFLAAAWYWTVARPINTLADRDDIRAVSIAINGSKPANAANGWRDGDPNGLAERTRLTNAARALGAALLPTGGTIVPDYGITQTKHGYRADTPANATGNSNGPRARTDFVVIHTEEGNSTAPGLADYCNRNNVSYNLIVDDRDTVENVPVGEAPWAAADANGIGVHICFAGSRAAWTRDQWLARGAALDRAAKATAAACQQYNIPVAKIAAGTGWNSGVRGIAAHGDFGQRGGGHTDPGVFVWDDFIARVKRFMNPTDPGGTPVSDTQLDRIEKKLDLILDQLVGPGFKGWNQGGGRTLYDLTAASAAKQGIAGARDTKAS
ncbi:N-acetylmuramoyl-L-alanine amidase [Tsukamurella conjunctivitidis]|uniref:N-acetylmuramoyl-L-alanine amidase n=1 Tax=Tsukamurella conjunctivitidis TaxID=2592068 RepID=UPI0013151A7A|nr:N-acetylmuramoyl-L-alanine amidase [Tsukamurella conjunctivitidis]